MTQYLQNVNIFYLIFTENIICLFLYEISIDRIYLGHLFGHPC